MTMDAMWAERRVLLERAVRRLGGSRVASDADDLVQEGMIRLMRAGADVNATYVWRTAWSVVTDAHRRRARRPEHGPDGLDRVSAGTDTPEKRLSDAEARLALQDCLQQAPESRRGVLTLYVLGHTPTECAAMLDKSIKSCENAVYRGLEQLRACLESKGVR